MDKHRNFIWNSIFVGMVLYEYMMEHQSVIVEWSFPEEELGAICLTMGTYEAPSLEKKYLMYYDIEEMNPAEIKERVVSLLDAMFNKI